MSAEYTMRGTQKHNGRRSSKVLLALVAGLLVTGTAACSDNGSTTGSSGEKLDDKRTGAMTSYQVGTQFKATKPLELSLLYSDHPNYPLNKKWMLWSEITKRTNVKLTSTVVPMSDYEQKRSLLVSSGDMPLIVSKTYPGQEQPFVASGAILPVSDYVNLMPNYQDKVKKWKLEPDIDTLRQEDGKYYLLPGLHEEVWQDYTLAFRTDELQRLGLSAPATWDDLYTVLKAIKQAHPNSFPLSDRFMGNSLLNVAAQSFGTAAGWGYSGSTWNAEAKKFEYTGAMPEYKQLVEFFHKLVDEGLMDPESFTQEDDAAIKKFTTGKSFAISTNAQNIPNDYLPGLKGIKGATVAKIRVPSGPKGDIMTGSRLENGLMISAEAAERDDFVAMMQFIDWLWYSDEGEEFVKWGVEGVTYDKDASGKRTLKKDIDFGGLNLGAPKHLQKNYGFQGGVFAYGGTTELLYSMFPPEEIAFQEAIANKEVVPPAPPHPFDQTEREQATLWETPLQDHVNQATLQFILGKRDLSTWDAYVKELEGKGMPQYTDLVNKAYQRYQEKHG
jgi:putative aldouronate transport system substrate-binding protein